MRERRVEVLTRARSMLSIRILPDEGQMVARRERARVDLPEPVRPMRAVVEPEGIVRVRLLIEGGKLGA